MGEKGSGGIEMNYGLVLISPIEGIEEIKTAGFKEKKTTFAGERPLWRVEAAASHILTSTGALVPMLYKAGDVVIHTVPQDDLAETFKTNSFLLNGKRVLAIASEGILCRVKREAP